MLCDFKSAHNTCSINPEGFSREGRTDSAARLDIGANEYIVPSRIGEKNSAIHCYHLLQINCTTYYKIIVCHKYNYHLIHTYRFRVNVCNFTQKSITYVRNDTCTMCKSPLRIVRKRCTRVSSSIGSIPYYNQERSGGNTKCPTSFWDFR